MSSWLSETRRELMSESDRTVRGIVAIQCQRAGVPGNQIYRGCNQESIQGFHEI